MYFDKYVIKGCPKKRMISLLFRVNNNLSIGQQLYIPKGTSVEETDYIVYQVNPNDTLYSISKLYNTTPQAIKEYNNLSSNLLSIGQIIQIPNQEIFQENICTLHRLNQPGLKRNRQTSVLCPPSIV